MTADPDRALLGASLAFAGAAILGSVVAIRDQLPGQPFGLGIPLSVPAGLAAGWGAAVAAPWPMPATAVITAATARHRAPSTRPGTVCAAIGLGCIIGTLIEPVTRRPRSWTPATRLAIGANLAASAGRHTRQSHAERRLHARSQLSTLSLFVTRPLLSERPAMAAGWRTDDHRQIRRAVVCTADCVRFWERNGSGGSPSAAVRCGQAP